MPVNTNESAGSTRLKRQRLHELLQQMGSALVAFSAGVDSTFLLYAAVEALGPEHVLAVTGASKTIPAHQLEAAAEYSALVGAPHETVATGELDQPGFRDNPVDRCFHCKNELYTRLTALARSRGLAVVLDGSNADDLGDYRPGLKAVRALGIRSPLLEAGLTKPEIRELSHQAGLPTWDKPAFPCLSSRIPYGTRITDEALERIDRGEQGLRALGLEGSLRVRHHGELARIEVEPAVLPRLAEPELRARIVQSFKALGYKYVTLDLQGFRSGSLNETLPGAGAAEHDAPS